MRKLIGIFLTAIIMVTIAMPALACTPRLDLKMPDLQGAYDAAYEAGKNAAKNVKISIPSSETETETELIEIEETETTVETETEDQTVSTAPVFGCTPRYDYSNIWGDLTPPSEIEYKPSEDIDKACENAAKKWLEEHPIDLAKETESNVQETESETVIETEPETIEESTILKPDFHKHYNFMGWQKYIDKFTGYFNICLR